MSAEKLQFVPVSSFVHPSFWNKLAELKINIDKLDDSERQIWGFFSNNESTWTTHVLEVDSTSFNSGCNQQSNNVPFHGKIFNKNTVEEFKNCDKNQLVNEAGRVFLNEMKTRAVLEKPSMLNFFLVLSFSDLKKYHFYYWFAFPVPQSVQIQFESVSPIADKFTPEQLTELNQQYQRLPYHQKPYFLIHKGGVYPLVYLPEINEKNYNEYYFVFADFINENKLPKSQLKNFVIFLLYHCPFLGGKKANFVLLFLDKKLSMNCSLVYELVLPEMTSSIDEMVENSWVGWEKNDKNKFGPRFSNMKATMDPRVLYEESVDLNLKLMKWRLLPDIDLDIVKNAKCLLLGAGTLGCSVARNLLGWGVRNVTFVDNSNVSYSNPVRQNLFTYEDAIQSQPKAEAAAGNLKKVFPSINSEGHQFTIPMPGHSVGESTIESITKSVEKLTGLIQTHDVIFLLTDSRESRWLPTLLGILAEKIIVNVALGFDTYLVMRYGRTNPPQPISESRNGALVQIPGTQLGCYFCNDVTAPGNSLKDRSLDQQCTVTRPGVSSIAGALAVELAVSILQHEEKINAPAFYKIGAQNDASFHEIHKDMDGVLGIIPHSIRGFLSSFSHVLPATPKFEQCIACSKIVLDEFKDKGFRFLLEVFNSSTYLENLTGLNNLFDESNYADVLEVSEDDEDWGN